MAGTLYIVATPIGNLEDMPPRVAATFGAADFIAAEDTRVTMKLLNFLGLTALAVSGQDTSRWVFEGFLPVNRKQKKERLAELLGEKRTVIFYEAPHKLRTTLDDLTAAFGEDRSVTLCRELTKLHEEIWKTTLGEAVAHYAANEPRGEYVLVMAGAPAAEPTELTLDEAAQRALELTRQGFGPSAAAKAAAQGTPYSKSEIYKQLLVLQQN